MCPLNLKGILVRPEHKSMEHNFMLNSKACVTIFPPGYRHLNFPFVQRKTASVNTSTSTRTMVKKVVDSRVHTLIKNCVQTKHRSFFVVVGDKGKDQVI